MALRLAFMGTPDFAVPTLETLVAHGHDVRAVYSQPARPKGRGLAPTPSPVAKAAAAHGIEVRTPEKLKGGEEQGRFFPRSAFRSAARRSASCMTSWRRSAQA